ncbi:MAG: hypothetical protein ACK5HT_19795 [Draconibacterium sp.]
MEWDTKWGLIVVSCLYFQNCINLNINKFVYICDVSILEENITLLKGIHPGIILDRELKKRKLPKRRIALTIGEFPQLLGDIT